jgi:hypothetical protein
LVLKYPFRPQPPDSTVATLLARAGAGNIIDGGDPKKSMRVASHHHSAPRMMKLRDRNTRQRFQETKL